MKTLFSHIPKAEARAGIASVVIGISLLVTKFVAYFLTGSNAIFSDAMESIVNVAASVFAMYSLMLSHKPADAEHPYGHGKVEFLSAGFEGGMILIAALVTAFKAIEAMVQGPKLPEHLDTGLILLVAALFVNGGWGWVLIRLGKRGSSLTLEADGWHLITDAITSTVAVAALLLMRMTQIAWIDPAAALFVALYIAIISKHLLSRSAAGLMDEQDARDNAILQQILDSHQGPGGKEPRICSYHKVRHRHSGRFHWVDFHIMVPASMNVDEGHQIASSIEYEIEQMLGEGNATAHIEPCKESECSNCASRQKLH